MGALISISMVSWPPQDRNENYQSLINEIGPVLTTLGNFKYEIILTGDKSIKCKCKTYF